MADAGSARHYEQWKRADVLVVACETMPQQVDREKVLNDLRKLHNQYVEDLTEET
jgi:hypothetical protein